MKDADRMPMDAGLELGPHGLRRCRVEGCRALLWERDICDSCADEIHALEGWCQAAPAKRATRLLNLACGTLALAVLWYLIWCFRDFIAACADLWFGGAP
jgi:hypothetical protein